MFGDGFRLPEIRSTAGTIVVLTARALPVRLRARPRRVPRAVARHDRGGADARAEPRARRSAASRSRSPGPRSAAGATLAVMEALADFGAVNLLNYRAMTDAIYRVWYGAFDRRRRCSSRRCCVALALDARRARAAAARPRPLPRRAGARRGGRPAAAARLRAPRSPPRCPCVLLLRRVRRRRSSQLVAWSVESLGEGAAAATSPRDALTSLLLAGVAALVAVVDRDRDRLRAPHAPVARRRGRRRAGHARLRGARHGRRGGGLHAAGVGRPPARRRGRDAARARPRPAVHRHARSAWSSPTSCASRRWRSSRSTRA